MATKQDIWNESEKVWNEMQDVDAIVVDPDLSFAFEEVSDAYFTECTGITDREAAKAQVAEAQARADELAEQHRLLMAQLESM